MSFGLQVTNDLQQKVLDENSELYVIMPATVSRSWTQWSEGVIMYERMGVTITYDRPYTSQAPPMIFMEGNGDHPSVSNPDTWDVYIYTSWYNDVRFQHFGAPGRWTGVFIGVIVSRLYGGPISQNWDLRRRFLVAGAGSGPSAGEFGLLIRGRDNQVAFNSNDNFVKVTAYSNDWRYNYRELDGEYVEVWTLHGAPVPTDRGNEWLSLLPFARYRRYNGETATMWTCNLTRGQNPQICIKGGRSGSPFHAPVVKIRTVRPAEYRYI